MRTGADKLCAVEKQALRRRRRMRVEDEDGGAACSGECRP
jgi:hypothetical protein